MTKEERAIRVKELEGDIAAAERLKAGILEDAAEAKKEAKPEEEADLRTQAKLIDRQIQGMKSEAEGLKNAKEDGEDGGKRRVRSLFGRR